MAFEEVAGDGSVGAMSEARRGDAEKGRHYRRRSLGAGGGLGATSGFRSKEVVQLLRAHDVRSALQEGVNQGLSRTVHRPPRTPGAPDPGATMRQTGSSRFCSAMRNFSFLLGFIDGSGLNRSL